MKSKATPQRLALALGAVALGAVLSGIVLAARPETLSSVVPFRGEEGERSFSPMEAPDPHPLGIHAITPASPERTRELLSAPLAGLYADSPADLVDPARKFLSLPVDVPGDIHERERPSILASDPSLARLGRQVFRDRKIAVRFVRQTIFTQHADVPDIEKALRECGLRSLVFDELVALARTYPHFAEVWVEQRVGGIPFALALSPEAKVPLNEFWRGYHHPIWDPTDYGLRLETMFQEQDGRPAGMRVTVPRVSQKVPLLAVTDLREDDFTY